MTFFLQACVSVCRWVQLITFFIRINSLKKIAMPKDRHVLNLQAMAKLSSSLHNYQCYVLSMFLTLANMLGQNILLLFSCLTSSTEYLFIHLLTIFISFYMCG